jgi:hypothetical protein
MSLSPFQGLTIILPDIVLKLVQIYLSQPKQCRAVQIFLAGIGSPRQCNYIWHKVQLYLAHDTYNLLMTILLMLRSVSNTPTPLWATDS